MKTPAHDKGCTSHNRYVKLASMRMLGVLVFALCSFCAAAAQATSNTLADNIDTSRTIIAKLDHAAQDDPRPNFASSILVRVHKEAASFIELADTTSATVRRGDAPGGTSMFSLYSQFIDLFQQYELFTSAETRPLALDKVRSVAMAKEYFDTKTLLEAATHLQITTMEEQLKSCLSAKRR